MSNRKVYSWYFSWYGEFPRDGNIAITPIVPMETKR